MEDFSKVVLSKSENEILVRIVKETKNWQSINILRNQIESRNEEIVKYKQKLFDTRCLSQELIDENSYMTRENQILMENIQRTRQWNDEMYKEISKFLLWDKKNWKQKEQHIHEEEEKRIWKFCKRSLTRLKKNYVCEWRFSWWKLDVYAYIFELFLTFFCKYIYIKHLLFLYYVSVKSLKHIVCTRGTRYYLFSIWKYNLKNKV